MNDMATSVVPAWGSALLHFLWQGALLGLLAGLGLTLLRNARPQARYALACAALSASLLLPALTLAWLLAAPTGTAAESLPLLVGANAGTANPNGLQHVLAMQATKSSPFIVLDEIDASFDNTNVGKVGPVEKLVFYLVISN